MIYRYLINKNKTKIINWLIILTKNKKIKNKNKLINKNNSKNNN